MSTSQPVIGYLLKTYPKLSETFILNEILELERQGLTLHIFSLRKPAEGHRHPGVDQVRSPVTYLPSLLPETTPAEEASLIASQVTLGQRDLARYLEGVQFHQDRPEAKRLNELLQGGYLALQLEALGIDHLHVHFANVPTATAEIAHAFTGIPYSVTAHAKDIYLSDPAALDRRFAKADFVLTCTDYNRRHLVALSTSSTPIYLAYHGLDVRRFSPDRPTATPVPTSSAPAPTAPLKLLAVGRFCEKKGFDYLLQACHHLQTTGMPLTCRIVGFGPLRSHLADQIQTLGLESSVTLVGELPQDQVIEQYRWADVFALPCLVTADGDRDGIPNVLLEAMAMALPVISTPISGIAELIEHGHNGLLIPEKDASALATAIAELAVDPALRQRLGQAGRHTVTQRFTLQQNVHQVKTRLLQALSRPAVPIQLSPSLSPILETVIR